VKSILYLRECQPYYLHLQLNGLQWHPVCIFTHYSLEFSTISWCGAVTTLPAYRKRLSAICQAEKLPIKPGDYYHLPGEMPLAGRIAVYCAAGKGGKHALVQNKFGINGKHG
jgi:hypothetical protein